MITANNCSSAPRHKQISRMDNLSLQTMSPTQVLPPTHLCFSPAPSSYVQNECAAKRKEVKQKNFFVTRAEVEDTN